MLEQKPTAAQRLKKNEGKYVNAIAHGTIEPSYNGLHPDTVDAIDAVALAYSAGTAQADRRRRHQLPGNEKA